MDEKFNVMIKFKKFLHKKMINYNVINVNNYFVDKTIKIISEGEIEWNLQVLVY